MAYVPPPTCDCTQGLYPTKLETSDAVLEPVSVAKLLGPLVEFHQLAVAEMGFVIDAELEAVSKPIIG